MVVKLFRAVHAQADEEIVLAKEPAPFVVEEYAVRLEGVFDHHARFAVFVLQFHGAPEKIESHERRLPSLPGNGDGGRPMRLEELPDESFVDLIGHSGIFTGLGVKLLLFEEKAVSAVQVAV
jgi:hypothetical protein